jgi:pectin methylesterase-like acyl-CoA thioesterase
MEESSVASRRTIRGRPRRSPPARLSAAGWAAGLAVLTAAGHAAAVTLAPGNGMANICTDAPLSIRFDTVPKIGTTGTINVFRGDGTLADSINLADPNSSKRTVGGAVSDIGLVHLWKYSPVIVSGMTASIYLHHQLDYGSTYYVTIDNGVLTDGQGFAGIQDPQTWRFSTRAAPPLSGTIALTVAADGSGDFCTVQGAIDFVPVGNTQRVDINVKKGVYTELVYVVPTKPLITVRGEDRDQTIVQYTNNDNLNVLPFTQTSDPNNQCINRRIPGTPDLWNCWRASFGVEANDFTLENITLHNTTPAGGSQAEAFRGNADRTVLNRVILQSFQDTTRVQGSVFVTNSYIEGDVDFTWGVGAVFFQQSQLHALRTGYYSMVRNDTNHGNVYINSRLTRAPTLGANTMYLSRIETARFPNSEAIFINDVMDVQVRPVGYQLTPAACPNPFSIKFWEYKSVDPSGALINTSQRLAPCSHQMTDAEATTWSDPAFILKGWVPNTINATPVGQLVGPTPAPVKGGSAVQVNWSAPTGHDPTDWVGLFKVGAADSTYYSSQTSPGPTTGVMTFTLPSEPGKYEFRYFLAGGPIEAATSNAISVIGPVIASTPNASVIRGNNFTSPGSFTQLGTSASWTATVDYGDGTGAQPLALTGTTYTLNHVYSNVGVYTVTVAVTDDSGDVGTSSFFVTVVYPASATPGDVNADGVVNCQDLYVARSVIGKRADQPGFFPTVDIDRNGVIDVRDISAISRLLPAGTVCP